MASKSLTIWTVDRVPRLDRIAGQCAASAVVTPPDPALAEENLRGYAVLLSAHFQGFCRELYLEATWTVSSRVPPAMQTAVQGQLTAQLALDRANPSLDTIAQDFDRFGFGLKAALGLDPANLTRKHHLSLLNRWRNIAAHQGVVPVTLPPLTIADLRDWQASCDGLAAAFDAIVYNRLVVILGQAPW